MTIHIRSFFNFKVLKHALTWLDEWHANLIKNLIRDDEFLTISTFEGLKMTTKSTIDLVEYLLNQCGFEYVLIAKINQDCLEVNININFKIELPNIINNVYRNSSVLFVKWQVPMTTLQILVSFNYIGCYHLLCNKTT